jgi:hypothetical protein
MMSGQSQTVTSGFPFVALCSPVWPYGVGKCSPDMGNPLIAKQLNALWRNVETMEIQKEINSP